jgi:hypothetical protein
MNPYNDNIFHPLYYQEVESKSELSDSLIRMLHVVVIKIQFFVDNYHMVTHHKFVNDHLEEYKYDGEEIYYIMDNDDADMSIESTESTEKEIEDDPLGLHHITYSYEEEESTEEEEEEEEEEKFNSKNSDDEYIMKINIPDHMELPMIDTYSDISIVYKSLTTNLPKIIKNLDIIEEEIKLLNKSLQKQICESREISKFCYNLLKIVLQNNYDNTGNMYKIFQRFVCDNKELYELRQKILKYDDIEDKITEYQNDKKNNISPQNIKFCNCKINELKNIHKNNDNFNVDENDYGRLYELEDNIYFIVH